MAQSFKIYNLGFHEQDSQRDQTPTGSAQAFIDEEKRNFNTQLSCLGP